MIRKIMLVLVLLFSFSFVLGVCDSDTDCDDGYACDFDGVCVEYCIYGETECSDGIDNDDDGNVDYDSFYCLIGDEKYSCDSFSTTSQCFIEYNGIPSTCSAESGDLIVGDSECRSPYDTDEISDPKCANGEDDDGDENIDYPYDDNCLSPEGNSEGKKKISLAPSMGVFDLIRNLLRSWII